MCNRLYPRITDVKIKKIVGNRHAKSGVRVIDPLARSVWAGARGAQDDLLELAGIERL